MNEQWKQRWDQRYKESEYAYGKEPNVFFKNCLNELDIKGDILFAAEGEGRNAVYAAKHGLNVSAFDISEEGKKKALDLATQEDVSINYQVGDLFSLDIINKSYDAAALIFSHFPAEVREQLNKKVAELIKPGGLLILEGFSTSHLPYVEKNPAIGGPKDINQLFSKEQVINDFEGFETIKLEEKEVNLQEGLYHQGIGSVIRYIGRKL